MPVAPARKKSRTPSSGSSKPRRQRAAISPSRSPIPTAKEVGDLAWAGQHALAIDRATAALAPPGLDIASRLDLLDLRAESFIAQGDLDRAGADASAMLDLAQTAKTAAFTAQALNRNALVKTRSGEFKTAIVTAIDPATRKLIISKRGLAIAEKGEESDDETMEKYATALDSPLSTKQMGDLTILAKRARGLGRAAAATCQMVSPVQ